MAGDGFGGDSRPSWWIENERLREELSLPRYEPSRFNDGTYTFRVINALEAELNCKINILGVDPEYPEDWEVRVDNERLFAIGRHRDESGNTVFEMTADDFETAVRSILEE